MKVKFTRDVIVRKAAGHLIIPAGTVQDLRDDQYKKWNRRGVIEVIDAENVKPSPAGQTGEAKPSPSLPVAKAPNKPSKKLVSKKPVVRATRKR